MSGRRFSAGAIIDAAPATLYQIIADYHQGHPAMLPKPPFVSLEIERGGRGAGTEIRVGIRVLGMLQTYRAVVSEPEPGRVLVETNDTGYVTTFTVEPRDEGSSLVRIETEAPERKGLGASVARWLVRRLMHPVFAQELKLLGSIAGAKVEIVGPA
jgi:hypothetical protein